MLVHNITITNEDIAYAEKILLKEGQTFEDEHNERIDFIKDLTTLDLQAVPGSGKTTVLLAKLLILERYLPFDDSSGILVISHTNTAINEIKDRIGKYCPKLFSYPNFIGTIQSFINKFLVNPFYKNHMKQKLAYIDTEIYENMLISEFEKVKWDNPPKLGQWLYMSNGRDNDRVHKVIKNIYYDFDSEEVRDINTNTRLIACTNPKHDLLKSIVFKVLSDGVLSYKYAYKLANYYIQDFPKVVDILRKRFSFVCIDEMQDMDNLQYDLLEKLFFESNSETIFQRIGDKNQAIYNGGNIETDIIWEDREKVLNLTGTNRFSQTIATFVQNFGITHVPINSLQNYSEDFKPHIFKYNDENIQEVIPKYSQLIKSYVDEGKLQINEKNPFKVIAWRKEHDTHIALKDYFEDFEQSQHKVKENYENLKSYLVYFERGNNSFKGIRKSILNAFIKILRLENIKDENDRLYTRKSLINVLKEKQKEEHNNIYDNFNLNIYKWCKSLLISNDVDIIFNQVKQYIPSFLNIFEKSIVNSRLFITNETLDESTTSNLTEIKNIYNQDGIDIHISTIHSVKGETHTATLYLESFYNRKYESEVLNFSESTSNLLNFNKSKINTLKDEIIQLNGERGTKTKEKSIQSLLKKNKLLIQNTKMAYVGFSRPSHLLCIAIHEDRFCDSLSESGCYEIINV